MRLWSRRPFTRCPSPCRPAALWHAAVGHATCTFPRGVPDEDDDGAGQLSRAAAATRFFRGYGAAYRRHRWVKAAGTGQRRARTIGLELHLETQPAPAGPAAGA